MSVWRDIRCDVNASDECWDRRNGGPQGFESERQLRAMGRKSGWTYSPATGDICPACATPDKEKGAGQ